MAQDGRLNDGRIQKLQEEVVNRIAAGEIIVAPANALKELLENSVDANSTSIEIAVKEGGLRMLQITDNGVGIQQQDMAILCERFTTSKLHAFEDLETIATYGFRGEALASISHISHVTVTTKTKDSPTAWKAQYLDGKIVPAGAGPVALAGKVGTQITVEDLFFNTPSRRRAFKNGSDEYTKILDVVGRYAVHCRGVAFSCKKFGDPHPAISVRADSSVTERIRSVFGSNVANNLLELKLDKDVDAPGLVNLTGMVTSANYSFKKATAPVLFINNRLVSCDPLRRALNHVYTTFLPRGGHYFAYLSLEILPVNVDVNVHPTKREVRFLYEEEIVEVVTRAVHSLLSSVDVSRAFQTQTLIPGVSHLVDIPLSQAGTPKKRPYEHNLVRTDARQPKITTLMASSAATAAVSYSPSSSRHVVSDSDVGMADHPSGHSDGIDAGAGGLEYPSSARTEPEVSPRSIQPVGLRSIKQLRGEVELEAHRLLTTLYANHTFVGIVDYKRRLAAIQHDVNLYLVDYAAVSKELFYQIGLSGFGNFGSIDLPGDVSVRQLLEAAYASKNEDPGDQIDNEISQLWSMAKMLDEYFTIELEPVGSTLDPTDLLLKSLPLLLHGYMPPLAKLPSFFYHLGSIDWSDELECLRSVLTRLALLHVPAPVLGPTDSNDENFTDSNNQDMKLTLRDVEVTLFPTIKRRLVAPRSLVADTIEIANLPGLYKVFERC